MSTFKFDPAPWVPFKDRAVIDKVMATTKEDYLNHPNKNLNIKVLSAEMCEWEWAITMFKKIKDTRDNNQKCVMILPNPVSTYKKVAYLINTFQVDCSHFTGFLMDEWADQDGNIAPESYPAGFMNANRRFFYSQIDEKLRMPYEQIVGPTNKNCKDYSKMIEDAGNADICFSGPGWAGHLAFIDPDVPEFKAESTEEWLQMGARITTLHPLTIAQNSLHGCFGCSGNIANVPPKAFTIGPRDCINSKFRLEVHSITTGGTDITWQRAISKLVLFGPVCPQLPTSLVQTVPTTVLVSEQLAAPVVPDYDFGY